MEHALENSNMLWTHKIQWVTLPCNSPTENSLYLYQQLVCTKRCHDLVLAISYHNECSIITLWFMQYTERQKPLCLYSVFSSYTSSEGVGWLFYDNVHWKRKRSLVCDESIQVWQLLYRLECLRGHCSINNRWGLHILIFFVHNGLMVLASCWKT